MSLELQCFLELAVKSKEFCERVSSLNTAVRAPVLIGGKSPATRSKRKKAEAEAHKGQAWVKLNAWNARVVDLEARATAFEKEIEQSASQKRVPKSKFSLL